MDNYVIETVNYRGYQIRVEYDSATENPLSWDNYYEQWCNNSGCRDFNFDNSDYTPRALEGRKKVGHWWIIPVARYRDFEICDFDDRITGYLQIRQRKGVMSYAEAEIVAHSVLDELNQWANGEVYMYCAYDKDGNVINSCGGYYDTAYMMMDARGNVDAHIQSIIREHISKRKRQIRAHTPLQYRVPLSA